jgi:hypothetical protein
MRSARWAAGVRGPVVTIPWVGAEMRLRGVGGSYRTARTNRS